MDASLQHKLQQFEVPPPPAVWDKIAAELESENIAADSRLSLKMEQVVIAPPADTWSKIDTHLHAEEVAPAVVIRPSFQWKRLAVAAVFIALIGIIAVYFLNSGSPERPKVALTIPEKKQSIQPKPNDTQTIAHVPPAEISPARATQKTFKKRRFARPEVSYVSNEGNRTSAAAITDDAIGSPAEAPLYELSTVSALQPVSVSAPPIRDKKGDLILDLSTIKNANDDYITVTGPNGKQTKMSTKFLSCIGYMNVNSSSELDSRAQRCKLQFEEWRNRLLSEPGFIPTANNFFDIFELKDLLEEM